MSALTKPLKDPVALVRGSQLLREAQSSAAELERLGSPREETSDDATRALARAQRAVASSTISAASSPAAKSPKPPKPSKAAAKSARGEEPHAIVALLKSLVLNGEYYAFRKTWPYALQRKHDGVSPAALYMLAAEAELAVGDHARLAEAAGILVDRFDAPEGYYYLAQSDFVRGNYDVTIRRLLYLLYKKPRYADAVYLLAEAFQSTDQIELAWRSLETLLPKSKRAKTWLVMANLVRSPSDFIRMLHLWQKWQEFHRPLHYNKDAFEYLALGAMRVGNYALAELIWQDSLNQAAGLAKGFGGLKPKSFNYSSHRAELALIGLNRALRDAAIPVFLVSGTLLGCVRENRLLGHDHDIDVGIWDDVAVERLLSVVRKSGLFYILASRTPEIIRLRHVNGIGVDVFRHFREPDDCWHRGIKVIWHNSPFNLVAREFLGEEFFIPENYDKYLTENYGDWRTPKVEFDSVFDTPNAEIISHNELVIHIYKMLMETLIRGAHEKASFYVGKLRELGGGRFAEELSRRFSFLDPG